MPSHKQRSLFFAGRTNVKKRTKVLPKPWPPDHASRKVEALCAIHKANVTTRFLFQTATLIELKETGSQ